MQELQQELLYTQIQTQEEERSRVAADLHDDVGATLAALRLSVAQVQSNGNNTQSEALVKIKALTDKAIDSIRNISHALTPAGLEVFGPVPVLEELAASLSKGTTEICVVVKNEIIKQPIERELALYRVTQELLNNVLKHAAASQVTLHLEQEHENILLVCTDNGKGFDTTRHYNGIGLKNIANRVKMMDGSMQIDSSDGAGTRVIIKLPVIKNVHGE